MTRGVLLFAFDTDTKRYTDMAEYCASRVKIHLDLPVTLVSNRKFTSPHFEKIITVGDNETQFRSNISANTREQWKNFDRYTAWDVTPYDETLLLDCDYIVNSNNLLKLWDTPSAFMCHKTRTWINGREPESNLETFGMQHYPMWWATVVKFDRSDESRAVFDMIKRVQKNNEFYAQLYGYDTTMYRNDYAISIAINTVYGHIEPKEVDIPWSLLNLDAEVHQISLTDNTWTLQYYRDIHDKTRQQRITVRDQDIHVLNKQALLEAINEQGFHCSSAE
jgi:hypothetical protein